MYGQPGRAYLYLVYGMHTCLNVVTEPAGRPAAVLVRAVELTDGIEASRALRVRRETGVKRLRDDPVRRVAVAARIRATPVERLASGPGLVGSAFGLDPGLTGLDLCDPAARLRLEPGPLGPDEAVVAGPRVGIDYAGEPWTDQPWRVAIAGHPAVSKPDPGHGRRSRG